jgi:hypothetical protein
VGEDHRCQRAHGDEFFVTGEWLFMKRTGDRDAGVVDQQIDRRVRTADALGHVLELRAIGPIGAKDPDLYTVA